MAAYDYESNFLTLHALGAKPVLLDVHAHNWQLDETKLEAAITPLTKAVICSHLHGGLVHMRAVMEIARRHNVGVVEDAAQAPGATVDGKPAGTWGDVGTLSFGGSKLLTAGRGGALLFTDAQFHQPREDVVAPRATAVGTAQRAAGGARAPNYANSVRQQRIEQPERRPSSLPSNQLQACPHSEPPFSVRSEGASAYYKLGFQYDPRAFGLSRELFVKALRAEGIAFDVGFKALHVGRSPSRFRALGELAHATDAHDNCVVLHHPVLSNATSDVQQVADAVAKVYRYRDELTRPA